MTIPAALQDELAFYNANVATLVSEHRDEFVLIRDKKIVGFFATSREALDRGYKEFGNEPFLVRQCSEVQRRVLFTSL
jgi:hypothetical protein